MPTRCDFNPNPLPLFLAEPEQAIRNVWTRAGLSFPEGEYYGWNGDSDRYCNSVDGKSRDALGELHGFAGRQIGAPAYPRSVGASSSIYGSGLAADRTGRADHRPPTKLLRPLKNPPAKVRRRIQSHHLKH